MDYIELNLHTDPQFVEILIAELSEIGYESFMETEEGLNAYIPENQFAPALLEEVIAKYSAQTAIAFSARTLEKRNWNREWELHYEPIEVNGVVRVRASFHEPDSRFLHELLINPKMSFGTGHHETTWLVMNELLQLNHDGTDLMDVGCGTGILGILARKLGASSITAFDIDEWAVENSEENFGLNGVAEELDLFMGTISDVPSEKQYDGILANINRNVLLEEIPLYKERLKHGGWLIVSGFYDTDSEAIKDVARKNGLTPLRESARNHWTVVVFTSGPADVPV